MMVLVEWKMNKELLAKEVVNLRWRRWKVNLLNQALGASLRPFRIFRGNFEWGRFCVGIIKDCLIGQSLMLGFVIPLLDLVCIGWRLGIIVVGAEGGIVARKDVTGKGLVGGDRGIGWIGEVLTWVIVDCNCGGLGSGNGATGSGGVTPGIESIECEREELEGFEVECGGV